MKEESPSRLEITDKRAAALLLNSSTRQFLAPFIGEKKGVKEASDEMGIEFAQCYAYVKQFERAGLLEVVERVPRAGRAIKRYRSTADEFFIPNTVSPLMTFYRENEQTFQNLLWQAMSEALEAKDDLMGEWGFKVGKPFGMKIGLAGARAKGREWNRLEEDPIILPYWGRLKLTRDEARALQRNLYELVGHYDERNEQDGEREGEEYLLRVAMAPLPKSGPEG